MAPTGEGGPGRGGQLDAFLAEHSPEGWGGLDQEPCWLRNELEDYTTRWPPLLINWLYKGNMTVYIYIYRYITYRPKLLELLTNIIQLSYLVGTTFYD